MTVCRCGFGYLNPRPPPEEIERLYGSGYFTGGRDGYGYTQYFADLQKLEQDPASFPNQVADRVDALLGLKGKKLLDVGCAAGTFLAAARRRGAQVWGVEPSAEAAKEGERIFQVPIVQGYLGAVRLEPAPFDVVTLLEVIEHPPHPRELLRAARAVCRPGGHLALTTPNFGMARFYGRRYAGLQCSYEHLFYWTEPSLRRVLEEEGFEPQACEGLNWRFVQAKPGEPGWKTLARRLMGPLVAAAPKDFAATTLLMLARCRP